MLYTVKPHDIPYDHNIIIMELFQEIKKLFPGIDHVDSDLQYLNLKIGGYEFRLTECELLLELENRLIGITFLDNCSNLVELFNTRNNPLDVLIYSQLDNGINVRSDAAYTAIQGYYCRRWAFTDLDGFFSVRKTINNFSRKLVFRGNYTGLPRNTIFELMNSKYSKWFIGPSGLNREDYFLDLIKHSAGLSIPGVGEFCYRDLEYMAIGLPMLRFEFVGNFYEPLLPNFHYISIPREEEMTYVIERSGSKEQSERYAKLYIDRFKEVLENKDFLDYISHNARTYYEEYLHPSKRVNHLLKLMGLV